MEEFGKKLNPYYNRLVINNEVYHKMKTAAIYCGVSTEEQERKGTSHQI